MLPVRLAVPVGAFQRLELAVEAREVAALALDAAVKVGRARVAQAEVEVSLDRAAGAGSCVCPYWTKKYLREGPTVRLNAEHGIRGM
jgi:hypothetical protein